MSIHDSIDSIADDDKDNCTSLVSLPPEVLCLVLRSAASSAFTLRLDGTLAPPDLASLCRTARTVLLDSPELSLRCAHLKFTAHKLGERRDAWAEQLGVSRSPATPLRPTVLDLFDCNVHANALCAACGTSAGTDPACPLLVHRRVLTRRRARPCAQMLPPSPVGRCAVSLCASATRSRPRRCLRC
jgi:hypothetical protein